MMGELNGNVPPGPVADLWTNHKFDMKLVAPSNRRKFEVIVVGSGLAGASAAINNGYDHDIDRLMPRTARRPTAVGRPEHEDVHGARLPAAAPARTSQWRDQGTKEPSFAIFGARSPKSSATIGPTPASCST